MTTRLAAAFARARAEQRPALITLVIPGFPAPTETDAVFDAMVEGGADIVEVEIPFSDPLADGATIQRASFAALAAGTTPSDCIDFVRRAPPRPRALRRRRRRRWRRRRHPHRPPARRGRPRQGRPRPPRPRPHLPR